MSIKSEMMKLKAKIEACNKCGFEDNITRGLRRFGTWFENRDIIVLGEAPGVSFSDPTLNLKINAYIKAIKGNIIGKYLEYLDLSFKEIFFTNLVKCPQKGRPPDYAIKNCSKYFEKQLKLIKPKVVIPLGRVPTEYLLKSEPIMIREHTTWFKRDDRDFLIVPLYHPGFFLKQSDKSNQKEKAKRTVRSIKALIKRHSKGD